MPRTLSTKKFGYAGTWYLLCRFFFIGKQLRAKVSLFNAFILIGDYDQV